MKAYSSDLRQKIVNRYEEGNISQRELALQFQVAVSFVETLLKRYRETGSVQPKVRTQQTPTKLNVEQISVLEQLVEAQNDATLQELRDRLAQKTGVSVSSTTIHRMLVKLNLSVSKKTFHASEKETERVQQQRVEFWQLVRGILAKDLIFIDEAGVNLAMARTRARSRKGQRAHGKRPQQRGKNVSMIGAIGLSEVIAQMPLLGAVDGLLFEAFIAQKLVPKLWKGACVILDNCSIHKGNPVIELIQQAGARVIFLPPYSPEFSPIENCWSKIKILLRSLSARTYPALVKAIEQAFAQVSTADLQGWFTHCCYCT
ncbi:MAG: IS630 family transposase [Cyanobacteria bacterium RM1_2_2]|nr:IS630 family transposase [Cyanobacteria bacterium RM1_2_2]